MGLVFRPLRADQNGRSAAHPEVVMKSHPTGRSSLASHASDAGRRLEYLSARAEPIRSLDREAEDAGRRGDPHPVTGSEAPEVFAAANALFTQFADGLKRQAVAECADDVQYLVHHAVEYLELRSRARVAHP